MIDGIPFTNAREVSVNANENDSIFVSNTQSKDKTPDTHNDNSIFITNEDSEDSAQHTVNQINSIEDIEIPGVDQIDVKRSELWYDMGNNEHSVFTGSLACQLPSVQKRHKQASLANNSASRNAPTRGITTRIHAIGGNVDSKYTMLNTQLPSSILCDRKEIKKSNEFKIRQRITI